MRQEPSFPVCASVSANDLRRTNSLGCPSSATYITICKYYYSMDRNEQDGEGIQSVGGQKMELAEVEGESIPWEESAYKRDG